MKQTEAQRLADELDDWSEGPNTWELTSKAAALLLRQDELLKQALEALEGVATWVEQRPNPHPWDTWQRVGPAIDAIRAHLEAK